MSSSPTQRPQEQQMPVSTLPDQSYYYQYDYKNVYLDDWRQPAAYAPDPPHGAPMYNYTSYTLSPESLPSSIAVSLSSSSTGSLSSAHSLPPSASASPQQQSQAVHDDSSLGISALSTGLSVDYPHPTSYSLHHQQGTFPIHPAQSFKAEDQPEVCDPRYLGGVHPDELHEGPASSPSGSDSADEDDDDIQGDMQGVQPDADADDDYPVSAYPNSSSRSTTRKRKRATLSRRRLAAANAARAAARQVISHDSGTAGMMMDPEDVDVLTTSGMSSTGRAPSLRIDTGLARNGSRRDSADDTVQVQSPESIDEEEPESEEYDYDDPKDSEYVYRDRSSSAKLVQQQMLVQQHQQSLLQQHDTQHNLNPQQSVPSYLVAPPHTANPMIDSSPMPPSGVNSGIGMRRRAATDAGTHHGYTNYTTPTEVNGYVYNDGWDASFANSSPTNNSTAYNQQPQQSSQSLRLLASPMRTRAGTTIGGYFPSVSSGASSSSSRGSPHAHSHSPTPYGRFAPYPSPQSSSHHHGGGHQQQSSHGSQGSGGYSDSHGYLSPPAQYAAGDGMGGYQQQHYSHSHMGGGMGVGHGVAVNGMGMAARRLSYSSVTSVGSSRSSASGASTYPPMTPPTPLSPLTPMTPGATASSQAQQNQNQTQNQGGYDPQAAYGSTGGYMGMGGMMSASSSSASTPNMDILGLGSSSLGGGGISSRRRSRPSNALPVPIPVPNLTKKSRGRRVPTVTSLEMVARRGSSASVASAASSGDGDYFGGPASVGGRGGKGSRVHTCKVPGCGKCFARGEHLKRHVRSIHTYEKPHKCPYPGCGKDFSRHDNLGQHMRVHKDYRPPK
ncbi:hypothetical protein VKT23_006315 [Stygiomarasmius scandens]|uniref:C2H2-type domain-containing protein n=1 Tax=Marasmiellus scandens TaxID=2682957 RepID=A0ABR1JQ97_9AGAR